MSLSIQQNKSQVLRSNLGPRAVRSIRGMIIAMVAMGMFAAASTTAKAQPSNDRCSNAINLSLNSLVLGSTAGSTSDLQGTACADFLDPFDIWYRFTPSVAGTFEFNTDGSSIDTSLGIYSQCTSGLITCAVGFNGAGASAGVELVANQTVLVRVAGLETVGTILVGVTGGSASGGTCCRGVTCRLVAAQASCTGPWTMFISTSPACNAPGNLTTPCCKADFNKSGSIGVQDIFDFLAAWFAGDTAADSAGNGTSPPTVQAIFDFLLAWFAGGC